MTSENFQFSPYDPLVKPRSSSDALLTESIRLEEIGQRLTNLGWASGLLDGEGCFRVASRTISIAVESTSKVTIAKLYELFKGSRGVSSRRTSAGKTVFLWRVHGHAAKKILMQIIPYLIEKKKQAILLSRYYNYVPRSEMRETIERHVKELKRTG